MMLEGGEKLFWWSKRGLLQSYRSPVSLYRDVAAVEPARETRK